MRPLLRTESSFFVRVWGDRFITSCFLLDVGGIFLCCALWLYLMNFRDV